MTVCDMYIQLVELVVLTVIITSTWCLLIDEEEVNVLVVIGLTLVSVAIAGAWIAFAVHIVPKG